MKDFRINERKAFVKDIVEKAHAEGVVIGLSGGKDSACVAALCVDAGVKVHGVQLPIYSSKDDDQHVRLLCERFPEIEMIEWAQPSSINALEEAFEILSNAFVPAGTQSLAKANIKPRLRMIALYALAQSRNCLVVGTGNASEAYVGYFTKWGDGAHDFNPIADLLKDEVVELGLLLGVPAKCMTRQPSAGLWEGQTDEGEMGFTYADIAKVMKDETTGISPEVAKAIMTKHFQSLHKLNPIPTFRAGPAGRGRGI